MSIPDSRLTEFALGILDTRTQKAISRELAVSLESREELRAVQQALDTLAVAQSPLRPSQRLRRLVMGSLDAPTRFDGFVDRLATLFDLRAERIRELLATVDMAPASPWARSGIPGVRVLRFSGGERLASATCGLVQVEPGRIFPAHRHRGDEWIIVLQGFAQEDGGRVLAPGDLLHSGAGSSHTFLTLGDQVFVFAVVLSKRNKWLWGRTVLAHLLGKKRFGRKRPE